MGIAQELNAVVAAFRGVSVSVDAEIVYTLRATSDPNDVQTPTVFVPVPDIEFQFSKRRLSVSWVAYAIPPNSPKQKTSMDHLSAIVDAVAGLFPYTDGQLFQLTLPGSVNAQAYRLAWNSVISIGD